MLASEASADFNAEFQNIIACFFGLVRFFLIIAIIEDERVQIAIARVEHIGDAQAIACHNLVNATQHQRQLSGRDRAIHADIIRDPTGGTESGFTALPDGCRFHGGF